MARNFIGEAQALADRLDVAGLSAQAQELRDAIDFSSTGSEILTGLRFHLHQLERRGDVPADLAGLAKELAAAIHVTLSC